MYIKNKPLDSYQQLRTMGALCTEKKGNLYQIFTSIDSKVHTQAENKSLNILNDAWQELVSVFRVYHGTI